MILCMLKQSHKNIVVCIALLLIIIIFFQNIHSLFSLEMVSFLLRLRTSMESQIHLLFPGESAELLLGILIGRDEGISWKLREQFRFAGLSHIFAISGYNVSLVVAAVFWIFIWMGLWRRQAFWGSIFFIIAFTIFVGGSASVVRASVMALIVLFSREVERIVSPVLLLLYTAVVMVIFSPHVVYDIGFQLSFAATAGLLFLDVKIFRLFPPCIPKWVRKNISQSFAAFLPVAPIIFFHFRTFSLIGPFANLLVLPTIPLIMLFGFISLVASYIFFPLAQILAAPAWVLLEGIQKFVEFL